jgi:hypothetical protein
MDDEALCREIRAGGRDAQWNETLDKVLVSTIMRVRIVRPDHLSPEHREMDV